MKSQFSEKNRGPSIIINSGSVSRVHIREPDRFKKFSLIYTVGVGNATFQVLKDICERLAIKNNREIKGVKFPWKEDDGMVEIRCASKKRPAVMDHEKRTIPSDEIRDGNFCKLNLTPFYYTMDDSSWVILPDGSRRMNKNKKKGITLFLNGVMLMSGENSGEDLF